MIVKFSPEDDLTEIVYLVYKFRGYKLQDFEKFNF